MQTKQKTVIDVLQTRARYYGKRGKKVQANEYQVAAEVLKKSSKYRRAKNKKTAK